MQLTGQPPSPTSRGNRRSVLISLGVVVVLIVAGIALLSGYGSTDGGHIAVVRNGGPLDNHKIRQIVPPGSGRTRVGFASTMHDYPTSQRFYTISSNGKGDANESITVPTSDGVSVGVEGSAYFTVNTNADNDYATLKDFDNKYGTRKFKCSNSGDGSQAIYEGDTGFSCFLDQIVAPVINNELRVSIGSVKCSDLVSSCSLVQNSSAVVDPSKIGQGNVNLAKIESGISSGLSNDLNSTLGGDYFTSVKFNLAKIDLDAKVQAAISEAQSAFAQVSQSQADLKKAEIEAQANEAKQKGYTSCPVCAQQDLLAKLPQGITVFAPGNGSGISLAVPAAPAPAK